MTVVKDSPARRRVVASFRKSSSRVNMIRPSSPARPNRTGSSAPASPQTSHDDPCRGGRSLELPRSTELFDDARFPGLRTQRLRFLVLPFDQVIELFLVVVIVRESGIDLSQG